VFNAAPPPHSTPKDSDDGPLQQQSMLRSESPQQHQKRITESNSRNRRASQFGIAATAPEWGTAYKTKVQTSTMR
jgi:hypothetical protein